MIEGRCVLCCVTCKEVGLTISGHLHSNSHCTDTDDIYTLKKITSLQKSGNNSEDGVPQNTTSDEVLLHFKKKTYLHT